MPEYRQAIVNSSPLILLSAVDRLDLLAHLADSILVPQAVADEVQVVHDRKRRLELPDWLQRIADESVPTELLEVGLGLGEIAVIAASLHRPEAVAVLDDRAARREARARGIMVVGTLGLVALGKRHGLLNEAAQLVEQLKTAGMYVSARLLRDFLKTIGE